MVSRLTTWDPQGITVLWVSEKLSEKNMIAKYPEKGGWYTLAPSIPKHDGLLLTGI